MAGERKQATRANKGKSEPAGGGSAFVRLLGTLAGFLASLALLAACLVGAVATGFLPAPGVLLEAPEEAGLVAVAPEAAAGAKKSALVKKRAFAVARRERVRTTLALSAAELSTLLSAAGVPVDAVALTHAGIWITRPARIAGLPCRATVALASTGGGALAPAKRFVGRYELPAALPAWAGMAPFTRAAREVEAGLARALDAGTARLKLTPADGELLIGTM